MSRGSVGRNLSLEEFEEWLEGLGVMPAAATQGGSVSSEKQTPLRERLRDGIFLCQLVNLVKPGSVAEVRSSLSVNRLAYSRMAELVKVVLCRFRKVKLSLSKLGVNKSSVCFVHRSSLADPVVMQRRTS